MLEARTRGGKQNKRVEAVQLEISPTTMASPLLAPRSSIDSSDTPASIEKVRE